MNLFPSVDVPPVDITEQMVQDLYAEGRLLGFEGQTQEVITRAYIQRFGKDRYEFLRGGWKGAGLDPEAVVKAQKALEAVQLTEITKLRTAEAVKATGVASGGA